MRSATSSDDRLISLRLIADVLGWLWLGAAGLLVVLTWRDYGITWDEAWHLQYGDHILAWFSSLGVDRSALSYRLDYLYGGGFDLLGALARQVSPLPAYDTMHLLGGLIGVLGLAGAWRLGRRLGGPVAGVTALILLSATPVYWGHMFNNPKDLPFAVGYVWALFELVALVQDFPRIGPLRWTRIAIVLGLAASVRVGGLLVFGYFALTVVALVVLRSRQGRGWPDALTLSRRLLVPVGLTLFGAWTVMLLAWPWAQLAPLSRPVQALTQMATFSAHDREMLFAGEPMRTTQPRWDYLLHYLGLKLPVAVLGLALAGAGLAVYLLLKRPHPSGRAILTGSILAVGAGFPLLYAMLGNPVLYDGLRHFLFVVPPLCVVAGVTLVELVRRFGRPLPLLAGAAVAGTVASTVLSIAAMVQLHPHQSVYFNRFAGGLAGAVDRYDTDYYGNTYKEAFDRMADALWERDRQAYLNTDFVVSACMPRRVSEHYLLPNFRLKTPGRTGVAPADVYLGYTRGDCHLAYRNAPVLVQVERDGAVLNVVRDLAALRSASRRTASP